ncbi:MAG: hypothetical protein IMZ55_07265 [Acidobacteria bacterium]|jgi:hypothetical protein|nr:hypothetical protein [Acidobacteriota bacterium]
MEPKARSALGVGTLLIVLGVFFLVTRIVPNILAPFSWPWIVIGVGAAFMIAALVSWTPGLTVPACIIGGIGGILLWQNSSGLWGTWSYAWALIPGFVGVGVFISEVMEGRPLKGLIDGGTPIVVSAILFFVFGSLLGRHVGGFPEIGNWWAVGLILIGVLVVLRPLVGRRNKGEK